MQEMNREDRGKDKPTDVLSYPSYSREDVGFRRLVVLMPTNLSSPLIFCPRLPIGNRLCT